MMPYKMHTKHTKILFILTLILFLPSCLYRMPKEDDFSVIPDTNHPDIVKDSDMMIPSMNY